jgi:HD superfamily phosphohydrolase
MEVRDPVHGSIKILDEEISIIEAPFFQRLRNIKQLGFSEYIFPGATHTRYIHSIGVMDISTKVFHQVFKHIENDKDIDRLHETVRLACLLHDIGHAPLSHTTEFVMPNVSELKLPENFMPNSDRQATHEDYTIKSIVDSSFTASFKDVTKKFGVTPEQVAEVIIGSTDSPDYFTHKGINYFPLLHQMVSSEMDCDRMDYLLRDSYFCGVSYGKYDLDWIIDNLKPCVVENKAYVGISERAVATFDDFLLCRFHMFLMVYFHYKSVCIEKMLERYFTSAPNEYSIPANIEEYLEHDDHFLMKVLRKSENEWAKKIIRNQIPTKILETFGHAQDKQLDELAQYFQDEKIDFIKCSTVGRLSKYYADSNDRTNLYPLKVMRESSIIPGILSIRNINEATDLFEKFSSSHTVKRIHCDFDALNQGQKDKVLSIIKA